jgi:cytochrome c-type protein NapC|tara:strand:- start:7657 stop:8301 length:645 start_codon:yes stop_codon:yes gene_type:complete
LNSALSTLIVSTTSQYPFLAAVMLFTGGILFWGAFNWSIELSNTETFCLSCHEMRDNIYPEYRRSVHFENASGVRAICSDCHVPREWLDKVVRKIRATNELFHKVVGSIDSREKFLSKRLTLARYVWSSMQANDSLECRNCHELTYMSQSSRQMNKAHARAIDTKMTCIDCHKGIAHELPQSFIESEHIRYENDKTPCGNCHADLDYGDDALWE